MPEAVAVVADTAVVAVEAGVVPVEQGATGAEATITFRTTIGNAATKAITRCMELVLETASITIG